MAPTIDRLRQALEPSTAQDPTAAYLTLALGCEWPRPRVANAVTTRPDGEDPPLLRYRRAICSGDRPTTLVALREADERWTDTLFFEGKYEMGSPARAAEPARAAALLRSAGETYPDSMAIRLMLANAQEMNGDFADALASFDRVLASRPAHVDALLGRVKNLSYLGRANEGIAAATALIDLATWHVGEAYYWRAWNAYQTRRLEPAWADVQQALRLLANTSVYALAGSVAYARRELDTAIGHFDRAFEIDPSNCLAVWSAGLVHVDTMAWPPAADRFSKATACFAMAAKHARTELAALDQTALEPAVKARVSSARKRAESAEELGGQAALQAAQCFLNTNQKSLALTYVELAARHASTRDKAEALRPAIDGLR
jgi:tetratricopeptide (TPR) repeat protein